MTLTNLWNDVALPLLGLAIGLGSCVAVVALFKLFNWLMEKLS